MRFDLVLLSLHRGGAAFNRPGWHMQRLEMKFGKLVLRTEETVIRSFLLQSEDIEAEDWQAWKPYTPPVPKIRREKIGNFEAAITVLKEGGRVARGSWQEGTEQAHRMCIRLGHFNDPFIVQKCGERTDGGAGKLSLEDVVAGDWYRVVLEAQQ